MSSQSDRGLFLSFLEILEEYKTKKKKPTGKSTLDLEFMIPLILPPDCLGIRRLLHSLPQPLTFFLLNSQIYLI